MQMFNTLEFLAILQCAHSNNHFHHGQTPDIFTIYIRLPVKYSDVIFSTSCSLLKNSQLLSKASTLCLYFFTTSGAVEHEWIRRNGCRVFFFNISYI